MNSGIIKLDGVLNIARVAELHAEFEELDKIAEPLIINASNVKRVDTAVLQLLVCLFRSMPTSNMAVKWEGVSEEFKVAAKLLGLETELKLV